MIPPIASPHDTAKRETDIVPFRGLKIFVAVGAVFLLLTPLLSWYSPHAHSHPAFYIVLDAVDLVLWGLLLWRLWSLSPVARGIFWWLNALSLVFLVFRHSHDPVMPLWVHRVVVAKRWFLLFGLVWLQLPGVKAHFRREKKV